MKDNTILLFIKWGASDNMESLLNNGTMYLNTVKYFADLENEDHQGDSYEGISKLYNSKNIEVKFTPPGMDEIVLNEKSGLVGDLKISDINIMSSNLYSMTAITWKDYINKDYFTEDFLKFGDTAIIIYQPLEFIKRFKNVIMLDNYSYSMGLVEYYSEDYEGDIGIFKKRLKYSYQKEFRISIQRYKNEFYKLDIGSIKDIAFKLESKNAIQMKIEKKV